MFKNINIIYDKFLLNLNKRIFCLFYNFKKILALLLCYSNKIEFLKYDKKYDCYKLKYNNSLFYILEKNRTLKYLKSLDFRFNQLAIDYLIDEIAFEKNDIVIDIGANIGELNLFLNSKDLDINYHAFEPAPREFQLLKLNNTFRNCKFYNIGLWHEKKELEYFVSSKDANSSLIAPPDYDYSIKINVDVLDNFNFRNKIKLIKLDSEGCEPEVLKGSIETLKITEYVSVDTGFERGINQDNTINEVKEILTKYNFEIIKSNYEDRIIYLFKNKRFNSPIKEKNNKNHMNNIFCYFGQNGWGVKFYFICEALKKHIKINKVSGISMAKGITNLLMKIKKPYMYDIWDKDKLVSSFLTKRLDRHKAEILENKYNLSLWRIILSERRFTNIYHTRKYSSKKYSHNELIKIVVGMFEFYEKALQDYNIILTTPPSSSWGYVLVLVANKLNKKVLNIDQIGIPNNQAILTNSPYQRWNDVDDDFLKNKKFNDKIIIEAKTIIKNYRNSQTKPSWHVQKDTQGRLIKLFNKTKIIRFLKNVFSRDSSSSPFLILKEFIFFRLRKFYVINFYNSKFNEPSKREEYFYYPLHVEPEASLMLSGFRVLNQIAHLQKIAKQLPVNYKIYVKEHPTMLGWRHLSDYRSIFKIPNIKIISNDVSNHELIINSKCVLTVCGTSGWESILLKKPVILFGEAFYKNLSTVYYQENIDKFSNAIKWIENEYKHNEDELIRFLSCIVNLKIEVPYEYFWGIPDDLDTFNRVQKFSNISENIALELSKKII